MQVQFHCHVCRRAQETSRQMTQNIHEESVTNSNNETMHNQLTKLSVSGAWHAKFMFIVISDVYNNFL